MNKTKRKLAIKIYDFYSSTNMPDWLLKFLLRIIREDKIYYFRIFIAYVSLFCLGIILAYFYKALFILFLIGSSLLVYLLFF